MRCFPPAIEVLEIRIAPANALNVNSSGSGTVVLDLTAMTISGPGLGSAVSITGIDVVNLMGTDAFTIKGTTGADHLDYTPMSATAGAVMVEGLNLAINFSGITGAFTIDPLGGGDIVSVNCQSGNNFITAKTAAFPTVQVGTSKPVTLAGANVASLVINGNTGNDQLTVDSTAGAFLIPITYNGGPGFDTLVMQGGNALSSHFAAGATPDAGTNTLSFANGTESISFTGLEPVVDSVAGPLTVTGTNGNDTITYTAVNATNGLISVNNQETLQFTNKTSLTINSLSGNDVIVLNNPNTPTALTSIIVNGSAASNGDTVIVNGGSSTAITVSSLTSSGASVTGAQPVPVTVSNIAILSIVGAANNAGLTITSPSGGSEISFTPGATADSGSITHFGVTNGTTLLPIDYSNLGGGGSLTFSGTGGARVSSLEIHGQDQNEAFNVASSGQIQVVKFTPASSTPLTLPINTTGVNTLTLDGTGDNDQFNVTGSIPFANTVLNHGGLAALSNASGSVTINPADSAVGTQTLITGYGGSVELIGVASANLNANNQLVTSNGTSLSEKCIFTPTSATGGVFQIVGLGTVFHLSSVAGNFRVFNGGGNADEVVLQGSEGRDLFEINQTSGVAAVFANDVTGLLPVALGASVEILTVQGLGGQDTFQVIPTPGLGGSIDNLLINIEGGSGGENNSLILGSSFGASPGTLAANQFVVVNQNSADSGSVRVFTAAVPDPDINYENVQVVSAYASGPGLNQNLVVMSPSPFVGNHQIQSAAFLGASSSVTIPNAKITPDATNAPGGSADADFFSIIATQTGFLNFQVNFHPFSTALAPGGGQLVTDVFDGSGNLLNSSSASNAQISIAATTGQTYYLEVSGATAAVFNSYEATITNQIANQTPTISAPSTAVTLVNHDAPIAHVTVNDLDAGNGQEKVTLSAGIGFLSLGSLAGLTFTSGSGTLDHTMTFTGTISAIDNALAGLTYRGVGDTSEADTVAISVNDQGSAGAGGPLIANAAVAITPNFHTAQVLSDSFKIGSSSLVINGSDPASGSNDTIVVNPGPVKNSYQVILDGVAQPLLTGVNGRILVFGQDDGTDVIQINKSIKAQTLLVGGTGNDTITGGGGVNFISGGFGNNTLNGGASGKNTLFESEDSNMTLQSGTTKTNGSLTSDGIDDVLIKNTFKNAQLTVGPSGNTLDASHFVGNTVLVGGSGNDSLIGGSGFNVLIGGGGVDTLQGGKNSDLLIGGTTAFDANITALSAILAEWSSTTAYATKIAHLLGTKFGGLNGPILLNPATVFDDGAANNLTGGAGLDWFFQGSADVVNDLNAGLKKPTEIVTSLG